MSPAPSIPLPSKLDAVCCRHGSFESEDDVGTKGWRYEDGYPYGSGSGLRDVDGFGYDMRPGLSCRAG